MQDPLQPSLKLAAKLLDDPDFRGPCLSSWCKKDENGVDDDGRRRGTGSSHQMAPALCYYATLYCYENGQGPFEFFFLD